MLGLVIFAQLNAAGDSMALTGEEYQRAAAAVRAADGAPRVGKINWRAVAGICSTLRGQRTVAAWTLNEYAGGAQGVRVSRAGGALAYEHQWETLAAYAALGLVMDRELLRNPERFMRNSLPLFAPVPPEGWDGNCLQCEGQHLQSTGCCIHQAAERCWNFDAWRGWRPAASAPAAALTAAEYCRAARWLQLRHPDAPGLEQIDWAVVGRVHCALRGALVPVSARSADLPEFQSVMGIELAPLRCADGRADGRRGRIVRRRPWEVFIAHWLRGISIRHPREDAAAAADSCYIPAYLLLFLPVPRRAAGRCAACGQQHGAHRTDRAAAVLQCLAAVGRDFLRQVVRASGHELRQVAVVDYVRVDFRRAAPAAVLARDCHARSLAGPAQAAPPREPGPERRQLVPAAGAREAAAPELSNQRLQRRAAARLAAVRVRYCRREPLRRFSFCELRPQPVGHYCAAVHAVAGEPAAAGLREARELVRRLQARRQLGDGARERRGEHVRRFGRGARRAAPHGIFALNESGPAW